MIEMLPVYSAPQWICIFQLKLGFNEGNNGNKIHKESAGKGLL